MLQVFLLKIADSWSFEKSHEFLNSAWSSWEEISYLTIIFSEISFGGAIDFPETMESSPWNLPSMKSQAGHDNDISKWWVRSRNI